MKLGFFGGAGEVTGSCFRVETSETAFLVDCGMFQGGRGASARNRALRPFRPRDLGFVLLTHAHIDHSGLLPRLTAYGYGGPIYATEATCDLLEVMLTDSAHIQEREAEWAKRSRGGAGPAVLYSIADVQRTLKQLRPVEYNKAFLPHPSVRATLRDAGHILGSAIIETRVQTGGRTRQVVFSGDLGQPMRPIVRDPTPVDGADVLLVESTYGNRVHKGMPETLDELENAIRDTLERKGGNVIVPAFAVGRTQDMLYVLADLHREGRLPDMDVYVDSPMAMKATEITVRHLGILDPEAVAMASWLRRNHSGLRIRFVQDVEESMALRDVKRGAVIISASGMCDAGRIKQHLRHNLGRRECSILFTGFQAEGTLGRRIVDGAKEVRIFGVPVPVRADVYTIGGLSAHADRDALLGWLRHFRKPPAHTFVVHGEQEVANGFARLVSEQLGWDNVAVPVARSTVEL